MSSHPNPSPHLHPRLRPGRSRFLPVLALAVLVAATAATFSQSGNSSPLLALEVDPYPNFDIRTVEDSTIKDKAPAREYLARFAAAPDAVEARAMARVAGIAALESAVKGVDIQAHPALKATEVVSAMPGTDMLTGPSDDRVAAFREFLTAHADAYGVSAGQVAELDVVADYANPAGNMSWVEFEQRFNGIPVFQGLLRGGFTAKGELARTTGVLATGIDATALASVPSVSAAQAVSIAAANVGWDVPESVLSEKPSETANHVSFGRASMAGEPSAWLVYFPLADGVARLAWATQIIGDPYGFLTVVDGETGTILFRKNLTNFQSQSGSYNVYPSDSPAPASPSPALPGGGYQALYVPRQTFTLIGNEAPNTFNNLGWMTDGANETAGNNVRAGLDLVAPDGIEATVTGTSRVFNFAYDPETAAPSTANYRSGEVTDMFYWTNRYHDSLYLLGFTEAARNFQVDNFGRGGVGNDAVKAEGQDYSGTNNANFLTPADGTSGRMQMYIFPGPNPDRTSGIDHDVLLHELTHGTSNRLHNNGSGLGTAMSGGMGEGWSDFYARALLSDASESVSGVYPTGGWVTNLLSGGFTDNYYYGIRRFPYAVMSTVGGPMNRPHNPLTFADIDPAQINTTDGAYARSPIIGNTANEVHNVGEVWSMALLEVRARFITRLGFAVGNQRFLQFVTDGMKLDPVNPTLLQGRDAILAAAVAGGNLAADIADIWAGFAVRGMGVSAQVVSGFTVVEAFDAPGIAAGTATLVSESIPNGRIDPGETVGVSFCIVNNGSSTSGAVTGTLQSGGGVTSPSTAQGYGAIPVAATVCRTFTFTASVACGATINATLQAEESSASTRNFVYNLFVGTLTPFATQNFDGVAAPALPAGWSTSTVTGAANPWTTNTTAPDTAPNKAFVANPAAISDNVLLSPSIGIPAGPAARLTFRNFYNTESTFDGGVLEISVGGGAFQDIITAGGSFVSGGYNGTLSSSFGNPLGGRQAWTGNAASFLNTVVTLPAAASGQSAVLRWRMGTDSSVSSTGWSIDTIVFSTVVCGGGGGPVPTSVDDAYVGAFNTALMVAAPGVLANDNSNGGGAMSAQVVSGSGPTNGSLTLNADGSFSYTPNGGFVGADGFSYRASNGNGPSTPAFVGITVSGPTTVQAPYNLRVDSVVGTTVTLRWDVPSIGPRPGGFILEGGFSPGEVLASIPTGTDAPVFTFAAPSGSFFIRMHAALGADKSGPSNEVPLLVNVPLVPSAPSGLLGMVNGSSLALAWKNTFAGGPPSGLMLDVTGSLATSIPMGLTDSFSFAGVPGGSYNLSLRATNAGGASPSSNTVSLTFPDACSGAPQPPANFVGYKIGSTVYVLWDAPTSGVAPTGYVLNVTGAFAGSFPTTGRSMSGVVGPGTYNLSVVATNPCGSSAASPVQVVTVP
ncbi:MAG TPA: M36 family metallopeptidase [Vicinamibacterales bacterium]|nr:M36 family metallopeptidase [Vicinamibacterales bacterium]